MNIAFSTIIRINERNWEFNFRKLPANDGSYHVDVTDEKGGRVMFSMHKSEKGAWSASTSNLPLWIIGSEGLIGESIEQEEAAFVMHKKGVA